MSAGLVVLLRHGLTDWNDDGRFQGHADIPLNRVGREQAIAAAAELAGIGVTRVLSSDLARASETAGLIADRLGLEVELDARLREVDVGSWAGMSLDEIGRQEPDFWSALREGRDFPRSPSGETATQAGGRVADAICQHVSERPQDEVVLAVGHGLSLRVAALLLMGLDYSHARLFGGLRNCHWMVLKPGDDFWRMLSYNLGPSNPNLVSGRGI